MLVGSWSPSEDACRGHGRTRGSAVTSRPPPCHVPPHPRPPLRFPPSTLYSDFNPLSFSALLGGATQIIIIIERWRVHVNNLHGGLAKGIHIILYLFYEGDRWCKDLLFHSSFSALTPAMKEDGGDVMPTVVGGLLVLLWSSVPDQTNKGCK